MIPERPLREMVRRIQSFPELAGCMIGYHGDQQSQVLQVGSCVSPLAERIAIIIEEISGTDEGLNVELQRWVDQPDANPTRNPKPAIVTNRSRVGRELVGAGASCTVLLASTAAGLGGVAAEVPTGGVASFLVVASWVGVRVSVAQCANGILRLATIALDPKGDSLEKMDSSILYSAATLIVDAMGVVTSAAALPFAARNLWAVIARQRALLTGSLSFEALRTMNSVQRMKVVSEALTEASRTSDGKAALLAAAQQAQVSAATLRRAGLSVRHAGALQTIIGLETKKRLLASLRDIFTGSFGIGMSASPASAVGSASGSVNLVINLIAADSAP